jgi:sterol desaturase/sphingolipid hydroxylase (fatty acid hydroxylase superfamily)
MDVSQIQIIKAVTLVTTLCILLIAERIRPAVSARWEAARWLKNFSLAAINFIIGPVIVLPISHYAQAHSLNFHIIGENPVFALVLLDLWLYIWHRLNHMVPFLWRFHEVHHLDETLDSSSGLRFHFGEVILSALVRAAVIWLLNIPFNTVVVFETLVVVAALFHHSNLLLPAKFEYLLAKLVVTPSLHWVHHHAKRIDTDSNYATVLSFWDVIFRSRSKNARALNMKIGVEGAPEKTLLHLILSPFWKP